MPLILALDQGTTSSRAILFDETGAEVSRAQQEFRQYFPSPDRVEHDAVEIWDTQLAVARSAIAKSECKVGDIAAVGITNQRETTVVWDRSTGKPIHNAIVWQDRRTADTCERLRQEGLEPMVTHRTGLVLDPYFSATKIQWILDHVPGAHRRAAAGELAFGTIDTWLLWNLTAGRVHSTDATNASRTLLMNLESRAWDPELLRVFDIPESILPRICSSSEHFGLTERQLFGAELPVAGIAGDQQAALFGQLCLTPGMAKNTYGTGCFLLRNTGTELIRSKNRLLSTIAIARGNEIHFALEGSVFVGGAVVQWLRDGLDLIGASDEIETLAASVPDNGGVVFVPAFTGLGAPYWDPFARGTIIGLSRGTTKAHIARAALEAIAQQSMDVLEAMNADTSEPLKEIRVDGGAARNDLLMQIQADLAGVPVLRASNTESTALGAAYLAGLATGVWDNASDLERLRTLDRTFYPEVDSSHLRNDWQRAVERSRGWASEA